MIWVNFKIYKETFGQEALKLAEICQRVSQKHKVKIIPVVSALDFWRIKNEIGGEVWLQNIDFRFEGPWTGWLSPLQAIALGANGSLLNHSEHSLPPGKVRQILAYLKKEEWQNKWKKQIKELEKAINNFQIMVCLRSKNQILGWGRKLKPKADFIAYEPPELIGGDISVSNARPEVIKDAAEAMAGQNLIVGAGIKTREDVEKAIDLGAKGVLVSSGVVKAADPKKVLEDLAAGFRIKNNFT
jgi:triosephosphate isomerase